MKRIILPFTAYYENIQLQQSEASHQEMVEVELSDEDYDTLLPILGTHYLAENSGENVTIKDCNL